ncbi:hypothetical protein L227DRAFT_579889 [Lentinus tigrinus ALCF2SS1-6]|uniref:Uncharacterized protein n=2 Tax=Lentinus tigrinus TaxID=5365 RepID=A0A5C2RU63_9APHY|nr:hypothetical protein L227DRAFT_579889 [Lentinus tigrinus ALCF2SS1-6]
MPPHYWCFALPKSPGELASWAQLDRKMLNIPSHVRFRVAYVDGDRERFLTQKTVSPFRAFCEGVLPGITAKGRLSVLTEAPAVPHGAPRGCMCSSCAPAERT